jgi:hypothetical protein
MVQASKQGEIDIAGTILLENNNPNALGCINSIRISNELAYTFTLSRYSASDARLVQIYSFSLDAKDVFTDDFVYYLSDGDYLIAYTDIPGTNYLINIFDANS